MTGRIRKSISIAILLVFAFSWLPGAAPVLRESPEFTIYSPSSQPTLLSSFKGKVVMVEFFFLRSPKCLELAQTMNKLGRELGRRGFQPIAIAFPAPGSNADAPSVAYIADYFKLTYPVGYATKASVDKYLGRTGNEILNIPQVVIIDRTGMIRATSGGRGGTPELESENSLRNLIDRLLMESASVGSNKK